MIRPELGQLRLQHPDLALARVDQQRIPLLAELLELGERHALVCKRLRDAGAPLRQVGQMIQLVLVGARAKRALGQVQRLLGLGQGLRRLRGDYLVARAAATALRASSSDALERPAHAASSAAAPITSTSAAPRRFSKCPCTRCSRMVRLPS